MNNNKSFPLIQLILNRHETAESELLCGAVEKCFSCHQEILNLNADHVIAISGKIGEQMEGK